MLSQSSTRRLHVDCLAFTQPANVVCHVVGKGSAVELSDLVNDQFGFRRLGVCDVDGITLIASDVSQFLSQGIG